MASTTMSLADIPQSSSSPSYAHAANATVSIRGSPYVLATGNTTSSPSQPPALAGEPPVSPSITSSADDSRVSGGVSPAISLPDIGLAPIMNAPDDLDETVLEALRKPGDRLQVLKFADTMENLINERSAAKPNPRGSLGSSSTYHRLLIHRCCAYYKLTVEVDHATKSITMIATTESRIPSKRISELVPQEPVSVPSFKIMRRSTPEQRNKGRNSSVPTPSSASTTDSTPSLDNSASSEIGSGSPPGGHAVNTTVPDGGPDDEVLRGLGLPQKQSRATTGTSTPRKTLQERQAEYEMARNRIFSDLSQKEKEAAKLREDQEREREVRELHRQLAEDEEAAGELARNSLYAGGSYHSGPGQENPLRMVNSPIKAPNRDQGNSVPPTGVRIAAATTPSPAPSTDSEVAPLVSYPTLYDQDGAAYDGGSSNHPYPLDPASSSPYGTHPHPAYLQGPPQAPHPPYNGNHYPAYPPMGMSSVPSNLNNGHPMMMTAMGSYQPYHGMQPGQPLPPVPHGQMPPPNGINMGPYPMYSQSPANAWGDQRQAPPAGSYPAQAGTETNQSPTDQPYGVYPRSLQPNSYWQPPHPQMGNPEMPPPPPPGVRGPYPPQPNMQPNGQNYMPPPPPPFFNSGMQQHQPSYPPQQGQQPFPPPPPQHAQQYVPQYHLGQQAQRPGPGPQQPQRQLWNSGAQVGGKRGAFGGPPRPPQQQHQHHNRPPGRDGGQPRPGPSRGPSMREMRENKDYIGPASLIATPMSPPASLRSRSRTSSVSERSVSRGPTLPIGQGLWSSGGAEGLSPLSMRGGRQEFNGRPNEAEMGDRKRSGSLSGSVAESVSESGAVTPLDETASLASSTMSSASSARTFTSTSSKHPSLPSRPDYPQGLPMQRLYSNGSNASRSSQGSVRGKSASSSTSHSRTQSFQSQGRPSPYALAQADFPPLPGVVNGIGHLPAIPQSGAPRTNNAWTGNTRNILMVGGPLPEQSQDQARQPLHNRFEEQDSKFTRPPAKSSVVLYDPRNPTAGKVGPSSTTQASVAITSVAGENEARVSTTTQQGDPVDQSTLLAAKLELLVVGDHSAGSDVSTT